MAAPLVTGFSSLMTGDVSNSCISTVVTKLSAVFPLHGLEQKVCFTNAVFFIVLRVWKDMAEQKFFNLGGLKYNLLAS